MFAITTMATLCIGITATATDAIAQGISKIAKNKLVGSWTLVAISNKSADGKTVQTFGSNDGVLIFNANGTYVQALIRSDLPKFASNNRNTGTGDENKAVVQGSLAIYGTYKINNDGTLTLHMERSTFPNWNGGDQKRIVTALTASEMKFQIPAPSVGGVSEAVWKRVK
jgi:hypothetical protein